MYLLIPLQPPSITRYHMSYNMTRELGFGVNYTIFVDHKLGVVVSSRDHPFLLLVKSAPAHRETPLSVNSRRASSAFLPCPCQKKQKKQKRRTTK